MPRPGPLFHEVVQPRHNNGVGYIVVVLFSGLHDRGRGLASALFRSERHLLFECVECIVIAVLNSYGIAVL